MNYNTRIMRSQTSTSKFYKESIIYCVSKTSTIRGESCISVFLPKLINTVFRNLLNLNFVGFKKVLLEDIIIYDAKFEKIFEKTFY